MKLEDRLYTSTEVADILGVSLRSVYRYLEEDKLVADIKTATGRHRFSKDNIISFLHPQDVARGKAKVEVEVEASTELPTDAVSEDKVADASPATQPAEPAVEQAVVAAEQVQSKVQPSAEKETDTTDESSAVDWLTKFREAASKAKKEAQDQDQVPQKPQEPTPKPEAAPKAEPKAEPSPAPVASETFSGLAEFPPKKASEQPESKEAVPAPAAPEKDESASAELYYRSSLGGLKDIALNLDKVSRKSELDYAFSLQAGLSLHKPIKPFSMLHAYVREDEVPFFEKMLDLTASDDANAQLCLVPNADPKVFATRKEMHGLHVVSDSRLKEDLIASGDNYLIKEAEATF